MEHSSTNFVIFLSIGQLYKDILSNLLDQKISLLPLTTAIEDFASAAKEADDEIKVRLKKVN